jgi:hypothetical protein
MKLGPGLIASITTDILAILASNWSADGGCWLTLDLAVFYPGIFRRWMFWKVS